MNEIKLLSCPCCDSENLETGSKPCFVGEDIYIQCNSCGLKLQICEEYGWEELYKRWNTRKPMERIVKNLEHLCEQTYNKSVNGDFYAGARNNAYHNAIQVVKEVGGIE